ncbi:hypothetical protein K438DRAFT_1945047 [Mycena galopus ATCC 62051]|nr:hypothetical protein K438DRAFT_1945047 [Mycena galopus ATCC 62051]
MSELFLCAVQAGNLARLCACLCQYWSISMGRVVNIYPGHGSNTKVLNNVLFMPSLRWPTKHQSEGVVRFPSLAEYEYPFPYPVWYTCTVVFDVTVARSCGLLSTPSLRRAHLQIQTRIAFAKLASLNRRICEFCDAGAKRRHILFFLSHVSSLLWRATNQTAQSMLYRFRETQEPELAFGTRGDTQRSRDAAHGQRMQELARERAVAGELLNSGWQLIFPFVFQLHLPCKKEALAQVAKLWAEVEARQTRQVQRSSGEGGDGRVQLKVNSKAEVRVKG